MKFPSGLIDLRGRRLRLTGELQVESPHRARREPFDDNNVVACWERRSQRRAGSLHRDAAAAVDAPSGDTSQVVVLREFFYVIWIRLGQLEGKSRWSWVSRGSVMGMITEGATFARADS